MTPPFCFLDRDMLSIAGCLHRIDITESTHQRRKTRLHEQAWGAAGPHVCYHHLPEGQPLLFPAEDGDVLFVHPYLVLQGVLHTLEYQVWV